MTIDTEDAVRSAITRGEIDEIRAWALSRPDPMQLGKALLAAAGTRGVSPVMLDVLVGAGADPNFTYESYGITVGPPLSAAAGSSQSDIIRRLIDLGADPALVSPHGSNAMISATYNTSPSALENMACLAALGANLDVESKWGESPLSVASHSGRFDMVRLLLDMGADPARLGWTPLMHAVALGSASDCRTILKAGAALDHRDRHWERTPFLLATQVGEIEKAAMLREAGGNLEDRGRCGKTALMHAAEMNHFGMVEWLLAQGADPNGADDFGETALITAATYGATDCVSLLLRSGAAAHAETPTGHRAIDQAANIATVLVLREAGADINRINGEGRSLLIGACEDGNLEFVSQLLQIGADPNRVSASYGPLHTAVNFDHLDVIRLLLAGGADPNKPADDEWTPLFYAHSETAAQLLLDAGADRGRRDFIGRRAADFAKSKTLRVLLRG